MFITLEGIDGSGKTTLANDLKAALENLGYTVTLTREMGGCAISEEIRSLILNPENKITPMSQLLLVTAARVENYRQTILPALAKGNIVICDRYYHSTLAYQGALGGLTMEYCHNLMTTVYTKCQMMNPQLTLLLDVDVETSLERCPPEETDTFDSLQKNKREVIIAAFRGMLSAYTSMKRVDATANVEAVLAQSLEFVNQGLAHQKELENKAKIANA